MTGPGSVPTPPPPEPCRRARGLSLRVRLFAAFLALSVLTLALGAFAVRSVGTSGAMVAAIFDRALISTSYARSAVSEFAAMQAAFAEERLAADEAERQALRHGIAELADLLAGDLGIASGRAGSPTVARAAERAAAAVRSWLAAISGAETGAEASGAADFDALKRLAAEATDALDVLVNHVAGEAFQQRQRAQATIASAKFMTLVATLLALAGGGAAALLLSRRIIGPVAAASRAAAGIAAGRLDTPIPPGGRDELGTLLRAMERMRDAIRATIEGEKAERRSAEARLLDALEGSTEGVALTDAAGRIIAANARAAALLPGAAGLLRPGEDWAEAVFAALPAFGGARAAPELAAALSGPAPAVAEAARADGRWLRVSRSAARDGGAVAILSDVTGLKAKEAALAEANRRFGAALDNMSQGLALFGADDRLLVANRRALELMRLRPEAAPPGISWAALGRAAMRAAGYPEAEAAVLAQDRVRFAAHRTAGTRLRETPDGQVISLSLSPTADGGFVATWQDVTERERAQARIAHLARHDGLTGLPNRSLLLERLSAALEAGRPFALHCFDLHGFRGVNESHGTPAGDRVLAAVAERLRRAAAAGADHLPARLSGDQFAVLQAKAGPAEAEAFAARLAAALSEPHDLDGDAVVVQARMGFAAAPADGNTADALLRNAELAAERARAEGAEAGPLRFCADMDAAQRARRAMEAELRRAIAADALVLHYQPLVDTAKGVVTGFEALLRWRHPVRGWISPAEFVPVAEQSGLIVPLGEWALRRAARDAAGWPDRVRVAVNVSPLQFRSAGLGDAVLDALERAGLPPGRMEIEITESALLEDGDAVLSVLHRLRAGGVRVAMDDFGTGFSSLATLRSFPFDKIKIDQSFVCVPEAGVPQADAIVRAVAGLAAALGMRCTAEGVETAAQLRRLAAAGCGEVQGYLFSRPSPPEEVPAAIAAIEGGFKAVA